MADPDRSAGVVRLATTNDAASISQIYNHYVLRSTCTYQIQPESLDDRIRWLSDHGERFPATVFDLDGRVVGWGSLSKWNAREAYDRTAEVSIYVHHDYHRRRIGSRLLEDLIDRGKRIGHRVLIGGACTTQVASIRLQESLGFQQVGTFRQVGHKFDRWLDVVYLQLTLPPME
ncbi:MAG: N-acetyltransferase family protein [Planctomycetota bacterium]